ncbi:MAG: cytochrome c-type biogenesis protein CcmH [Albidovulum sp.]|nr:cytochrome c-type biogenesis protein CcmH [Albidovulum sp.]
MKWFAVAAYLFAAVKVSAVEPDELLGDPGLESRARAKTENLPCLICRNESIDESSAELASDLRKIVREQLLAGKSDEEVYAFVVDRYGEFVLLKPSFKGANVFLYASGPIMFAVGGVVCALYVRRRRASSRKEDYLQKDERDRLEKILGD